MDDVNKPKLQLRPGFSTNVDKSLSPPATKLLINHGKPNFTIQRSAKSQNGHVSPTSPPPAVIHNGQRKNNEFVIKSTTFNGVFRPSNISAATKLTLPQNGNTKTKIDIDNEAARVVLRRAKTMQTKITEDKDDENVPEFIRRQRRIQERLANQNILDFENRRSGYFTQVLISPSSPNRQSFVETMASPAVKPGLEIPPPTIHHENDKEKTIQKEEQHDEQQHDLEKSRENLPANSVTLNGHVEEEEVAKAIEEVNKAVEGEDDDKTELEEHYNSFEQETEQEVELKQEEYEKQHNISAGETEAAATVVTHVAEATVENVLQEYVHGDLTANHNGDKIQHAESNGYVEREHLENDQSENIENHITISHVNGLNGPSIPPPDPKCEKGVNFEPKTVVSFSQELGNEDNKYPDTIKVLKDAETVHTECDLKEMRKLKFEINSDDQDVEVKPILIPENV